MKLIKSEWKYEKFLPGIIDVIIDQQKTIKKEKPKKVPNVLIILDDCISEGAFNQKGIIEKLFYRARHFNISLLCTSQKYSSLSRGIRLNSKAMSVFKPYNQSEKQHILDEHTDKYTKENMNNILDEIWGKPYHFIHFDYMKPDHSKIIQCCFHDYITLTPKKL
jgi:hypothetical protein